MMCLPWTPSSSELDKVIVRSGSRPRRIGLTSTSKFKVSPGPKSGNESFLRRRTARRRPLIVILMLVSGRFLKGFVKRKVTVLFTPGAALGSTETNSISATTRSVASSATSKISPSLERAIPTIIIGKPLPRSIDSNCSPSVSRDNVMPVCSASVMLSSALAEASKVRPRPVYSVANARSDKVSLSAEKLTPSKRTNLSVTVAVLPTTIAPPLLRSRISEPKWAVLSALRRREALSKAEPSGALYLSTISCPCQVPKAFVMMLRPT
mmetsp:Transcript_88501/g.222800  ORF Transcript_88501/g.222800 Transcript_88501/m.222800 type:complete len:266 (+) Transcript_88501:83-880(+)